MTTIAWDGKTLAADGQETSENIISSLSAKKIITPQKNQKWSIRGEKVLAFASSGDACALLEISDHLSGHLKSDTLMRVGLEFEALVITKNEIFLVQKSEGKEDICISSITGFWTLGSGCDFALSAMKMGKTAKEAVEHAITIDLYSGGEVQTFECPE
jgi:ATP-dependent protease HslVU (ClpYQ) peptidase subunit